MTLRSVFTGVQALLVFPHREDERAVRDLMRRFSAAVRYAYKRLLEGKVREELKKADGPLTTLFRLNTRQADDAVLKAKAVLDSAKERGQDPRKVVFGGRGLFEGLKRRHLSGKRYRALKRRWKEARQGTLYARGDASKKGNPDLRLGVEGGALWLEVNLGERGRKARALVRTSHPHLDRLLERAYSGLPYTVELSLKDGRVYAHFTWAEDLPQPRHTRSGGVLGIDANAHPYGLALALVGPDGNLKAHRTLSLEEVDRAPNRGAKELVLWEVAHRIVAAAEAHGAAIATERLKRLRKGRRGDGSGRRALGLRERLPKVYQSLLQEEGFRNGALAFYEGLIRELEERRKGEKNPYLKRRWSRELRKAQRALGMLSSLQGSLGSRWGATEGRNPSGANPWRVLRVGLFLPLLGREVPRDLAPLKPILKAPGSWEGWKTGLGPHPGGGPPPVARADAVAGLPVGVGNGGKG